MTLFRKLIDLLEERDASDIVVFGGGIVPEEDVAPLEEIGVAKIFTPGATTTEITGWVARALLRAGRLSPTDHRADSEGQLADDRQAERARRRVGSGHDRRPAAAAVLPA